KDKNNIIAALSNKDFGEDLNTTEIKSVLNGKSKSKLFDKMCGFKKWCENKNLVPPDALYDYFELDDYLSPTSATYEEHKNIIFDFMEKAKEYIKEKNLYLYDGLLDFVNSSTLYGLNMFDETTDLEEDSVKLM